MASSPDDEAGLEAMKYKDHPKEAKGVGVRAKEEKGVPLPDIDIGKSNIAFDNTSPDGNCLNWVVSDCSCLLQMLYYLFRNPT